MKTLTGAGGRLLALPLLVAPVLADHPHDAPPLDDLAVFADPFD
jgi:hypothetical protein